jgi:hypothetical protein
LGERDGLFHRHGALSSKIVISRHFWKDHLPGLMKIAQKYILRGRAGTLVPAQDQSSFFYREKQ